MVFRENNINNCSFGQWLQVTHIDFNYLNRYLAFVKIKSVSLKKFNLNKEGKPTTERKINNSR